FATLVILFKLYPFFHKLQQYLNHFDPLYSAITVSITCIASSAFILFVSLLPSKVINAFQSAQPLALFQVSSSIFNAFLKTFLLMSSKNVQAIAASQAGSPTPKTPKSMTAHSFPSFTRRFPGATSPCSQTGSTLHFDCSDNFHIARNKFVFKISLLFSIAFLDCSS